MAIEQEKYSDWFKPDPKDPEHARLMQAGYHLAESFFKPDGTMPPDKMVLVASKIFNRAAAFGPMAHRAMVREAEGPLKLAIKGTRYLLLMRPEHLKEAQLPKLDKALKLNEPLLLAWYLKEELALLWQQPSAQAMERFLRQWCERALSTGIQQLGQMAKTLLTHWTGILNWWTSPINNGKREGTNNKIKTLTRQAYGYRDEDFFILKLLGLHESRYKLVG